MGDKANYVGNASVESRVSISASPVKKTLSKAKSTKSAQNLKPKPKVTHPKTSDMVNAAIKELKDRKGSSLQAIKKYIGSTYGVDGEKVAPFIKRYLKTAVTLGAVVQTKGKGASGSFKLSAGNIKGSDSKVKVQKSLKSVTGPKKQKQSVEKKTTPVRKPLAKKASSTAMKPATVTKKKSTKSTTKTAEKISVKKVSAQSKTISKSKKTAKAPAAKRRTPKPKKAATTKAVKAAAKK